MTMFVFSLLILALAIVLAVNVWARVVARIADMSNDMQSIIDRQAREIELLRRELADRRANAADHEAALRNEIAGLQARLVDCEKRGM